MNKKKKPYVFVIGNEKGGAGKTTCSIHLIIGLLEKGYQVASIDADARQHSLTSYLNNRAAYNKNNPNHQILMPLHFHLKESSLGTINEKDAEEKLHFEQVFNKAEEHADYIVIDTPGNYTNFSRLSHCQANKVITPINDSFIDLDVIAKIQGDQLAINKPSIYSQMLWEQKMERAGKDGASIEWIVLRNRLSNLDAQNKRNVSDALEKLSKRISFQIAPGFSERVIFRELFPYGLTLFDLTKAKFNKSLSVSHIAARQELRDFMNCLGIESKIT